MGPVHGLAFALCACMPVQAVPGSWSRAEALCMAPAGIVATLLAIAVLVVVKPS